MKNSKRTYGTLGVLSLFSLMTACNDPQPNNTSAKTPPPLSTKKISQLTKNEIIEAHELFEAFTEQMNDKGKDPNSFFKFQVQCTGTLTLSEKGEIPVSFDLSGTKKHKEFEGSLDLHYAKFKDLAVSTDLKFYVKDKEEGYGAEKETVTVEGIKLNLNDKEKLNEKLEKKAKAHFPGVFEFLEHLKHLEDKGEKNNTERENYEHENFLLHTTSGKNKDNSRHSKLKKYQDDPERITEENIDYNYNQQ